mgnify:CR=1 FL=1
MKSQPLYSLKIGDRFRCAHWKTGEPEGPVYTKGRPHTDTMDRKKYYVTFAYAPDELYHKSFTGYIEANEKVFKID